jgi:[ribosomal protein S5]-alanine N-acetyltransferase
MILLETERLILQDHTPDDVENLHRWRSNDEVMKYISFRKHNSIEESFIEISEILKDQKSSDRRKYFFSIFEKKGLNFIGETGGTIEKINAFGGVANIGYALLPEFWGMGYAAEATAKLIEFCFNELNLHKVIACCQAENASSEKVMIKCGLVKEGQFKKHRLMNDIWVDELIYGICREDWKK